MDFQRSHPASPPAPGLAPRGVLDDGGNLFVVDCTIFSNGGDGLNIAASVYPVVLQNIILRSNSGYGINTNTGSVLSFDNIERVCAHNNNGGGTGLNIDINGGTIPGTGHVLEDPGFVSETDGSENLTPTNANLKLTITLPAGATGGEEWIGAIQPQAAVESGDVVPGEVVSIATKGLFKTATSSATGGGSSIFGSSIIKRRL